MCVSFSYLLADVSYQRRRCLLSAKVQQTIGSIHGIPAAQDLALCTYRQLIARAARKDPSSSSRGDSFGSEHLNSKSPPVLLFLHHFLQFIIPWIILSGDFKTWSIENKSVVVNIKIFKTISSKLVTSQLHPVFIDRPKKQYILPISSSWLRPYTVKHRIPSVSPSPTSVSFNICVDVG